MASRKISGSIVFLNQGMVMQQERRECLAPGALLELTLALIGNRGQQAPLFGYIPQTRKVRRALFGYSKRI